ncbi:MAG: SPFH domain-containing protein [Acidimicrobiia bacterium]|jgi:regulator of protease activity HflC (stomatin/prohibitin superfamily)
MLRFVIAILLLVLAFVLFFVARAQGNQGMEREPRVLRRVALLAVIGALVFGFLSVLRSVDNNYAGVEVLFGRVRTVHPEGLHAVVPFATLAQLPGQQQESTYSSDVEEGEARSADAVESVTADNAVVLIDATVLWTLDLDEAEQIYRDFRTVDRVRLDLVRNTSREAIRDCVAQYRFEESRTSRRADIAICAEDGLRSELGPRGVNIQAVQIRNIVAQSAELQATIDAKLAEEQNVQAAEFRRQQAQIDAQTAVVRAEGERDAEIARAQGQAKANQLVSESLDPQLLEFRKYELLSGGAFGWILGGGDTPVIIDGTTSEETPAP